MKTTIQLTNQYKPVITSLYTLMNEIYEKYAFDVYSKQVLDKIQTELRASIKVYYPLIRETEFVTFQLTENKEMKIYIMKKFMAEMQEKYPEALI